MRGTVRFLQSLEGYYHARPVFQIGFCEKQHKLWLFFFPHINCSHLTHSLDDPISFHHSNLLPKSTFLAGEWRLPPQDKVYLRGLEFTCISWRFSRTRFRSATGNPRTIAEPVQKSLLPPHLRILLQFTQPSLLASQTRNTDQSLSLRAGCLHTTSSQRWIPCTPFSHSHLCGHC